MIECAVINLPIGIGETFFELESTLEHLLFSIPGTKGVELGSGFNITKLRGSDANDEYYVDKEKIKTYSNNNGEVSGGITNGIPLIFRVAIKPTASIGKVQKTVNIIRFLMKQKNLRGQYYIL